MIRIIIENDIFVSDKGSDLVNTIFYIDYQGKYFPDNQWTDFADVVLQWWTHALIKNKDLCDINFILYFMDGPFRLEVHKGDRMDLTINCINDRTTAFSELTIECSYIEFMSALYDAFKSFSFILYCNEMHKGRFEPVYRQSLITMNEIKEVLASLKT